ncbi:MAG TPA: hypothetical protein VEZ41_01085 [Allosphingosinicella sp.]|nr:hypothetical protein [Allosphingosinicella sp.]
MDDVVSIARRFRGPPDSGNGGYVAGILAKHFGGSACNVRLMMPPPLDVPLRVEIGGSGALLLHEDQAIAEAAAAEVDVKVPPPPTAAAARAAEARFTGLADHNFPGCFVCGPDRSPGDGLRIFPGAAGNQVAATWRPSDDLADDGGLVRTEYLWAALDCPGYFAVEQQAGLAVLGSLAVVLHRPVRAGETLIVTGWPIASEGRKHRVGTALHDSSGQLAAAAIATWVTLRPRSG